MNGATPPKGRLLPLVMVLLAGLAAMPAAGRAAPPCGQQIGMTGLGTLNQEPADMEAARRFLYTADSAGLTVWAPSPEGAPRAIGQLLLPEPALALALDSGRAWVANGAAGLKAVDISDPHAPSLIATFDAADRVLDVAVADGVAWIVVSGGDLLALDVTDPTAIRTLWRGDLGTMSGLRQPLATDGALMFVTADYGYTLLIVDASDPGAPALLGRSPWLSGSIRRLATMEDHILLADGDTLRILDVSDPANPVIVTTAGNGGCEDVDTAGNMAFAAFGEAGLRIFDLTDPDNPVQVGSLTTGRYEKLVSSTGVLTFLSTRPPRIGETPPSPMVLSVVDTSDPAAPEATGSVEVDGLTRGLGIGTVAGYAGTYAVVHDTSRVVIVDLDDPALPRVVASAPIPTAGEGWPDLGYGGRLEVAMDGGTAVLANGRARDQVADVSDPRHPVIAPATLPSRSDFLTLDSRIAYGTSEYQLRITDLSDPFAPHLLGTVMGNSPLNGFDVANGLAAIATGQYQDHAGGLATIDVSAPSSPGILGEAALGVPCFDALLVDDTAWAACSGGNVVSFDVSDPARPRYLGSVRTPVEPEGIVRDGPRLFVHGRTAAVAAIDTTDPRHPGPVTSFGTTLPVRALAVETGAARLWASEGAVIEGFDVSCPSCSDIYAEASPPALSAGGDTATVLVSIEDRLGEPAPGIVLTGRTSLGTLSPFQDLGDGTYRATLTTGATAGTALITLELDGSPCPAVLEVPVSCPDPVQAPATMAASPAGDGSIALSWAAVPGATGYRVRWNGEPLAVLEPDATSFVDRGAIPGEEACYTVEAIDSCGGPSPPAAACATPAGARPACPALAHRRTGGPEPRGIAIDDLAGHMVLGTNLVETVDLSTLPDLVTTQTLEIGSPAEPLRSPLTEEGLLLVARGDTALLVLDASDPLHPVPAGSVTDLPTDFTFAAAPGLACAVGSAPGGWRMDVVDTGDPYHPHRTGAVALDREPVGIAVSGKTALVADADGFTAIDLTDPASPADSGRTDVPGTVVGISAARGLAIVATANGTLAVFDLSDPRGPTARAVTPTGLQPLCGVRTDGMLAVAGTRFTAALVGLADPDDPVVLWSDRLDGASCTAALGGGLLAFAGPAGIAVHTLPCRAPEPHFEWSTVPLQATFTDRSLYGPASWSWDFGDGGVSSAADPVHTFPAAGLYTVTLTAANAQGSAALSHEVRIVGSLDVNGDGLPDRLDIMDEIAEIWDGDGTAPGDAGGGTHPGSPRYDVDGDGWIAAGDIAALVSWLPRP